MAEDGMTKYAEWCARQFWQYQRRGSWRYRWHGDTLVRYVEMAPADPDFTAGLLEYLKSQESVAAATAYNRPARLGESWKAVSAWYEQQEGQVDERTKLKLIRVYQALQRATEEGAGDGPYVVENGCRYKVSFTYHWKVERLPDVPQGTSGVSWQLEQISRDDETGLWSCCLVKRERVQQDVAEYTTDKTVFEERSEEQHLGVKAASVATTGKAASVKDGTMVRRKVQKNEDCTSDVINETVEEQAAEGAVEETRKTLRGVRKTTVNRNMPAKAATSGMEIGGVVRNEKTEGGRWNQTIEETEAVPTGKIQEGCRKTAFNHVHQRTENVAEDPGEADAPPAEDGVIHRKDVRRTDEGTYDVTEETDEEQAAEGAVEETRKTLRGVRKTTVNRNMPAKAATSGMKIGGVVRNEKTEGGRWNQTIEETEAVPTGKIQEGCRKTAFNHVHQRIENVAENPGAADAPEVSGGTIHRQEVRRTDEGTFDVTDETDEAIAAQNTVEGGAEKRSVKRTEYRNQQSITPGTPGVNREVNASVRTNEYGLLDGTVEEVEHKKASKTARGGTALYDEVETSAINDESEPDESPGTGQTVTCRVSPNEHGSATTSKIVRTAKPKHESKTWTTTDDNWNYTHSIDVYRNWDGVPDVPTGKYQANLSLSINEFGLIDAVVTTVARTRTGGSGEGDSESTSGTETRYMYYQKKDGNIYKRRVTAHFTARREAGGKLHTIMLDGAESGLGFRSHDDGCFGIKYTRITVGKEEKVS